MNCDVLLDQEPSWPAGTTTSPCAPRFGNTAAEPRRQNLAERRLRRPPRRPCRRVARDRTKICTAKPPTRPGFGRRPEMASVDEKPVGWSRDKAGHRLSCRSSHPADWPSMPWRMRPPHPSRMFPVAGARLAMQTAREVQWHIRRRPQCRSAKSSAGDRNGTRRRRFPTGPQTWPRSTQGRPEATTAGASSVSTRSRKRSSPWVRTTRAETRHEVGSV